MLWGILSSNALTLLGFNYVLAGYCKTGPRLEAIAALSAVTPLELFAEGFPCRLSPIRQIAVLVKGWTSVWFPYTVGTVIPALFRHAGAVYALLSFVLPAAYFMAIMACKIGRCPYKHAHRGYVLALVAGPELLSLVVTVQRVSRRLSPSDTRMMPISQPFFLYVFNIARPLIVMVFKVGGPVDMQGGRKQAAAHAKHRVQLWSLTHHLSFLPVIMQCRHCCTKLCSR